VKTFEERIKETKLTKTNRKIAEYCLNNRHTVAFLSSAELADRIGVSDVSIVRFARALGYSGFVDLKRAWQDELCQSIDSDANVFPPVARFLTRKDSNREQSNFLLANAEVTYRDLIHDTLASNSQSLIYEVADRLYSSQHKYIVGIRTRASAATLFTTLLGMLIPDIMCITGESHSNYLQLLDFTKDDCVFFFTYGRYSVFEQMLLERVKESGACLIVATDKRATHAALAADLLIYSAGDINMPFYSSTSNIVIAECIANAISEKHWDESRQRIELSEKYLYRMEPKK